jgi:putative oxidoreductase
MERVFGKHSEITYALFRIVAGVLFACHGGQKLFGLFGGTPMLSNPMMLAAGIIEFAGGVLVALGVFTGIAAFISSGEMAVAYFMAHAPGGLFPIVNKGELAVLYCFVFLYIATHGSGTWSLGRALGLGKGKR